MHIALRFPVALVGAALLGASALMFHSSASAQETSPSLPPGLKESIADYIEDRGYTYAGLCMEIPQHEHYGEVCAFVTLRAAGTIADVSYGYVASDSLGQEVFYGTQTGWYPGEPEEQGPQPPAPTPAEPSEPSDPIEEPTHEPVKLPVGLPEAIRDFLEQRGLDYAGLCTEIVQHEHYGEYCAFVTMLGDGRAKVNYGLVAGDQLQEETFALGENGWYAEASGPIVPPSTPTDTPTTPATPETPADGAGDDGDDSDSKLTIFAIFLGLGLVVGGAGAYGITRR